MNHMPACICSTCDILKHNALIETVGDLLLLVDLGRGPRGKVISITNYKDLFSSIVIELTWCRRSMQQHIESKKHD